MDDEKNEERELEQKMYELSRVKISELQHNVFILEANLGKRIQEVTELTDNVSRVDTVNNELQSRINTLELQVESENEDIDAITRKLELVIEHRDQLEEELQSLKSPYETVMELEPVVTTVVHEDQLELNLLNAVQTEEQPTNSSGDWEEGTMLESIDGTND